MNTRHHVDEQQKSREPMRTPDLAQVAAGAREPATSGSKRTYDRTLQGTGRLHPDFNYAQAYGGHGPG